MLPTTTSNISLDGGQEAIMFVISLVCGSWRICYGLGVLIRKEWLCLEHDRNVWKKSFEERIQEYGRKQWRNGFGMNERENSMYT